VPFGSSNEREVNKKFKTFGPGPGTYIDINNPNNSSICKSLNKIKEDRTLAESQGIKIGAFGSTQARFDKNAWNGPKEGPGPGAYDTSSLITAPTLDLTIKGENASQVETALTNEHKKANSVFVSTTNRFQHCYSSANPHIRILNSRGGPKKKIIAQSEAGKAIYDKQAIFGVENQITYLSDNRLMWTTHQARAQDAEQVLGRKVGFDATSPRFHYNNVFYQHSYKREIPGPGVYQVPLEHENRPKTFSQPRNKNLKYSVVFNTSEKRFKGKGFNSFYHAGQTQPIVGPGSYINNEGSMLKKSFNMSMENSYFV